MKTPCPDCTKETACTKHCLGDLHVEYGNTPCPHTPKCSKPSSYDEANWRICEREGVSSAPDYSWEGQTEIEGQPCPEHFPDGRPAGVPDCQCHGVMSDGTYRICPGEMHPLRACTCRTRSSILSEHHPECRARFNGANKPYVLPTTVRSRQEVEQRKALLKVIALLRAFQKDSDRDRLQRAIWLADCALMGWKPSGQSWPEEEAV